jgi:hypothetical protein
VVAQLRYYDDAGFVVVDSGLGCCWVERRKVGWEVGGPLVLILRSSLAKHLRVISAERRDKLITCPYFPNELFFQFI